MRANSKQWFTISFLQPLPYLVTPQGPENCQLTSSFEGTGKRCSECGVRIEIGGEGKQLAFSGR